MAGGSPKKSSLLYRRRFFLSKALNIPLCQFSDFSWPFPADTVWSDEISGICMVPRTYSAWPENARQQFQLSCRISSRPFAFHPEFSKSIPAVLLNDVSFQIWKGSPLSSRGSPFPGKREDSNRQNFVTATNSENSDTAAKLNSQVVWSSGLHHFPLPQTTYLAYCCRLTGGPWSRHTCLTLGSSCSVWKNSGSRLLCVVVCVCGGESLCVCCLPLKKKASLKECRWPQTTQRIALPSSN